MPNTRPGYDTLYLIHHRHRESCLPYAGDSMVTLEELNDLPKVPKQPGLHSWHCDHVHAHLESSTL